MVEVEVRNFQSIEKAALKVEGFTALVGRSNIGKTALVRAVKAALTGAPVGSSVRHGKGCLRKTKKAKSCKCFASVHLKAPGFDLLWEKGDAVNRYTFNGQVYDKTDKGTPEFLSPAFLPVKVGDQQTLLQVADQFSAIFLLDQTGGTVADVLSDVARLDRINTATRFCEKDRKEAVSTRKVREKDVLDLEGKLARFDGLDAAVAQARSVEAQLASLERKEAEVVKLDRFLTTGVALGKRIAVLEAGVATPVPDPAPLRACRDSFGKLDAWVASLASAEAAVARLAPIADVVVPAKPPIVQKAAEFERLNRWHGQLVAFRDFFNASKPVEALPPLVAPAFRDKLVELDRLSGLLARLTATQAAVARLEAAHKAAEAEAEAAHAEVEALGVCPTCVRPLEVA